ncbi:MAG TPA: single-stranded-DNA-specific exonuclease RecJ [Candidatus Eisenbacteria bacterium]|nr:single-stranded-DNA-specific exonuclease RecJ [Candidatus Eisenbacteria bacterium]
MKKNAKWEVFNKLKNKNEKVKIEDILHILMENRGLTTKKQQETFLHSDIALVTPDSIGLDKKNLAKALKRVQDAIQKKEQIVVFGDYDVDGIAGTAILWETLHALGANVTPFIPDRVGEGYGLSIPAVERVLVQDPDTKLIITVDNGIVANEAVDFANSQGIDVILTDHHTLGPKVPKAYAIVHSTALCGTGVAWVFSQEVLNPKSQIPNEYKIQNTKYEILGDHLALVALATVADLVPLTNGNRILLTEGLKILHSTKRPGIVAMCEEAGVSQKEIGVYQIGHMLAPRLNAMGRIASAMDSLRLLCTKDSMRAKALAEKLGITNKERQLVTQSITEHAIESVRGQGESVKELLFIGHESYEEGVIGLVAGKLVEEFYRPSIVLSIGEKKSKASARSIKGFNIIEFIRTAEHLLINAGGHPMAAGFSIETSKIGELEKFFADSVQLTDDMLEKSLRIDFELPLEMVTQQVYDQLQQLQPFGMGNPEPTFMSTAQILSVKQVGKEKNHLSLQLQSLSSSSERSESRSQFSTSSNKNALPGIAFGLGEMSKDLKPGQQVDIVYTIDENVWNDRKTLQLKIKDIKLNIG